MSNSIASDPNFQDRFYRPLRRACDDPELNFQKIRTQRLWLKHETERRLRLQRELDAALKASQ